MRAEVLAEARAAAPRVPSPVAGGYGEVDHQGEWAREEQQVCDSEEVI
jgi:hypothetical protein